MCACVCVCVYVRVWRCRLVCACVCGGIVYDQDISIMSQQPQTCHVYLCWRFLSLAPVTGS
jgi:hypothetical protein